MLLQRSILFKFLLVLIVTQLNAQEYESDHEELSSYDEGGEYHGHPDYSKYYSVDTSAPLAASTNGFVGELSGFNQPNVYSESRTAPINTPPIAFIPQQQQTKSLPIFAQNTQQLSPFGSAGLRDFFEESQKKRQLAKQQRISEDYVEPGPSYISHQVPFLNVRTDDEEKAASRDDVERIPPRPNKPKKDEESSNDDDKEYKIPEYDLTDALTNSKSTVDYNTGKSSSTVSQYPIASGYLKAKGEKATPYQKYSFQPVTEASSDLLTKLDSALLSTLPPFNPSYSKLVEPIETQSSEDSPASLKGCRKLVRPASDGVEKMNCFVCENEGNKSKYTQCSYSAEKEPTGYYTSNSAKYSLPSKDSYSSRYKRHARKYDPYYSIRESSLKEFEGPSIPKEYNLGFLYEPDYESSSPELSYSEKQTEELKKNPANCKKVEDKGMTCTVCKDPKTGGNYEQCSYSSDPKEKKYAYVTEKKYDSDDEPEETKVSVSETIPAKHKANEQPNAASSEIKPIVKAIEKVEKYEGRTPQLPSPRKRRQNEAEEDEDEERKAEYNEEESTAEEKKPTENKKLEHDYPYDIPKHFAETVKYTSRLGNPNEEVEKEDKEPSESFEDYHLKLFPELEKAKQEKSEDNEEEYYIPAATKHNVEEVLAQFAKKDRSSCKKSERSGMTCFLCVDENKIQHEECMYVQESRPKSSHVAYHEVKGKEPETKGAESENESDHDETKSQPVVLPAKEILSASLATKLSEAGNKVVPTENKASSTKTRSSSVEREDLGRRQKRETQKDAKSQNEEPTLKTPTEFRVGDEEGAFSAETKPVYSRTHGVELPRYMVEQSEFEKEFDYAASSY